MRVLIAEELHFDDFVIKYGDKMLGVHNKLDELIDYVKEVRSEHPHIDDYNSSNTWEEPPDPERLSIRKEYYSKVHVPRVYQLVRDNRLKISAHVGLEVFVRDYKILVGTYAKEEPFLVRFPQKINQYIYIVPESW